MQNRTAVWRLFFKTWCLSLSDRLGCRTEVGSSAVSYYCRDSDASRLITIPPLRRQSPKKARARAAFCRPKHRRQPPDCQCPVSFARLSLCPNRPSYVPVSRGTVAAVTAPYLGAVWQSRAVYSPPRPNRHDSIAPLARPLTRQTKPVPRYEQSGVVIGATISTISGTAVVAPSSPNSALTSHSFVAREALPRLRRHLS